MSFVGFHCIKFHLLLKLVIASIVLTIEVHSFSKYYSASSNIYIIYLICTGQ